MPHDDDRHYTVEEYFELDERSDERLEYWDGVILPLRNYESAAEGIFEHAIIAANILCAFGNRLAGGPCRIVGSLLKVGLREPIRYVYPDGSVVCSPPEFDPQDPRRGTIVNPRLLIDVLSPANEAAVRGRKLPGYTRIQTLEECVLVLQDRPRVETFFRQPGGTWLMTFVEGLEQDLMVRSLGFQVPLREIYAGIEFPPDLPGDEGA
jgi:Uma2 family endonuclease